MEWSKLLPETMVAWLRELSDDEVRRRLRSSIAKRAGELGVALPAGDLTPEVEKLDDRYFTLEEAGDKEQAERFFKQARVLAAHCFVIAGRDDSAIYEFLHSLDEVTAEAVIERLKSDQGTLPPLDLIL